MTEACPGCGAELRVEIASVKPASSDGMPVCTGCRKVRPGSEWVVLSDKTWWHAFCAADELHRQLAQRDERNAALEARIKELEDALQRLVQINEEWNRAVAAIIERPVGWTDSYLDSARSVLAKQARGSRSEIESAPLREINRQLCDAVGLLMVPGDVTPEWAEGRMLVLRAQEGLAAITAAHDDEIKELTADLAAVLPIVRAAVEQEYQLCTAEEEVHPAIGATCDAVRALTPEQRARLEEI